MSNVPNLLAIKVRWNLTVRKLELDYSNSSLYHAPIDQILQSELNQLPYKNLNELRFRLSEITEKWLFEHLSGLPLLEHLILLGCYDWERIEISSHRLKILELWHCKSPVEIKIDAPKLYRLSYMGGYIKSISSNALALSHAIYDFPREMAFYAPSCVDKIEFLSKLSNSTLLELIIESAKIFIDLWINYVFGP